MGLISTEIADDLWREADKKMLGKVLKGIKNRVGVM
jgi:hypothetical protein